MVRALMLDFTKAFDRVDHPILLGKLASLDLPNFIVRWITNFLCQRKQRVKIGQNVSQWAEVNVGVPQGTLCGPVWFLLHINDLWTCCDRLKYLNDSRVWEIRSSDCHDSRL